MAAVVDTIAIDESRSFAPQSPHGCTSRPLMKDDIHHRRDH
jgi:hypothetical protein